ncbi:unnamed protein product [Candida verbasci]|uniref:RRM domain-containing protein n=1 Tax=Candida verbasci TaxID=1227364 RepID=A0A9W4TZX4_9ASCO|nr:unnamed protein product [Candida verbasci]
MSDLEDFYESKLRDSTVNSFHQLEKTVSPKDTSINMNSLYSTSPWVNKAGSSSSANTEDVVIEQTAKLSLNSDSGKSLNSNSTAFIKGKPSACVFVASLKADLTDDELCLSVTHHFGKWGQLTTVKVLRDTSNRPYAFVQYTNDEESKLAIKYGHNSVLDGRNIRCEAAKVNRTLFVTFKTIINKNEVKLQLEKFGEIEELIPSTPKGGVFKDYHKSYKSWFCKFVYRDDAIRAFASLQDNSDLKIEWSQNIDKAKFRIINNFEKSTKPKFDKFSIFIGQLSSEVDENDLRTRFERHGEILEINLVKKINNTFAFIKYKDESSAASAVERENHSMFCNKTMHVQYKETQVYHHHSKSFNVPLAPPPINLNKKQKEKSKFNGNNFNKSIKRNDQGKKYSWSPTQLNVTDQEPKFNSTTTNFIPNGQGYPIYYYIPVENKENELKQQAITTGPSFYNVYPTFLPMENNNDSSTSVKNDSPMYNIPPSFMYYPSENDITSQEKKS